MQFMLYIHLDSSALTTDALLAQEKHKWNSNFEGLRAHREIRAATPRHTDAA